jgi:hypothetical protein
MALSEVQQCLLGILGALFTPHKNKILWNHFKPINFLSWRNDVTVPTTRLISDSIRTIPYEKWRHSYEYCGV